MGEWLGPRKMLRDISYVIIISSAEPVLAVSLSYLSVEGCPDTGLSLRGR